MFSGNRAIVGGGLFNDAFSSGTSNPILLDIEFSGNSADSNGGGIANDGSNGGVSSPSLTSVTLSRNSAADDGGALFNFGSKGTSSPKLENVIFSGNSADFGGALYNYGWKGVSSPVLTNTLFSGNSAYKDAGAMYNHGGEGDNSPILKNVTLSGNKADRIGGALYNFGGVGKSTPQVYNSIIWNNLDSSGAGTITATIFNNTALFTLTNSLVQAAGGSSSWITDTSFKNGGGNIDFDPLFITQVNPGDAPTETGNLRLKINSPAIDAGDTLFLIDIPEDLDGAARIKDGDGDTTAEVDMGAFEAHTLYQLAVTKTGTGSDMVASTPPLIDCGDICTEYAQEFSIYTFTAAANAGSYFTGWSGGCSGMEDCQVNMVSSKTITANFELSPIHVSLP